MTTRVLRRTRFTVWTTVVEQEWLKRRNLEITRNIVQRTTIYTTMMQFEWVAVTSHRALTNMEKSVPSS